MKITHQILLLFMVLSIWHPAAFANEPCDQNFALSEARKYIRMSAEAQECKNQNLRPKLAFADLTEYDGTLNVTYQFFCIRLNKSRELRLGAAIFDATTCETKTAWDNEINALGFGNN